MNEWFIIDQAKEMDLEKGIKYLKEYLMQNPVFEEFLKLNKQLNSIKEEQKEEENKLYPLLARVKRFPKSENNYSLLKGFILTDAPNEKKLEAYRLIVRYVDTYKEKALYSYKAYELSQDYDDLIKYAKYTFKSGNHKKAFNEALKAMPKSAKFISYCYEKGLGCEKSLNKSFEALKVGVIAHVNEACNELGEFTYKYAQYEDEADELVRTIEYIYSDNELDIPKYLKECEKRGYITEEFIYKHIGDKNVTTFKRLQEIIELYGYKVYKELPIMKENSYEKIAHVLKLFKDKNMPFNHIKYLDDAINLEMVEFYLSNYTEEPLLFHITFGHTPSEASIVFNMPRAECYVDFSRFMDLADNKRAMALIEYYIYYLTYEKVDNTFKDKTEKIAEKLYLN